MRYYRKKFGDTTCRNKIIFVTHLLHSVFGLLFSRELTQNCIESTIVEAMRVILVVPYVRAVYRIGKTGDRRAGDNCAENWRMYRRIVYERVTRSTCNFAPAISCVARSDVVLSTINCRRRFVIITLATNESLLNASENSGQKIPREDKKFRCTSWTSISKSTVQLRRRS